MYYITNSTGMVLLFVVLLSITTMIISIFDRITQKRLRENRAIPCALSSSRVIA